jgi:hypothetical protein
MRGIQTNIVCHDILLGTFASWSYQSDLESPIHFEFVSGEAEIEFGEAAGTDMGGAEYDAGEAESE